jgi:hypothetical protein
VVAPFCRAFAGRSSRRRKPDGNQPASGADTRYAKLGDLSIAHQVVVSGRDVVFVAGSVSHVEFDDRRTHELRGIPVSGSCSRSPRDFARFEPHRGRSDVTVEGNRPLAAYSSHVRPRSAGV